LSDNENLDAQTVAHFLQNNPGFFTTYADLLGEIDVPNPHGGQAIPLSDRQVLGLREKNRALEGKLGELIQFGEENDATSEGVHHLAVALLTAKALDEALIVLYAQLNAGMHVPHVALRIWHGTAPGVEFEPPSAELRAFAAQLTQPYCGPNQNFEAVAWFGEAAPLIRSVAFIPLRDGELDIGLLALGSEDAQRFFSGMGTLYLQRIGELAAAALLRSL
jgi:uncharacterized protein YigA (DUF484 family)